VLRREKSNNPTIIRTEVTTCNCGHQFCVSNVDVLDYIITTFLVSHEAALQCTSGIVIASSRLSQLWMCVYDRMPTERVRT